MASKIVLSLRGGLGNQIFQYALAKQLSLDIQAPIEIDVFHLNQASSAAFTTRGADILNYNIKYSKIVNKGRTRNKMGRLIAKAQGKIIDDYSTTAQIEATKKRRKEIMLWGYFQSPSYHEKSLKILSDELKPTGTSTRMTEALDIILSNQCLMIHIRRGDYISSPLNRAIYGVCDQSYYRAAVEYCQEVCKTLKIFVFTDNGIDPESILPRSLRYHHIDGQIFDAHECLYLMSHCNYQIISNSTFSWWSARLSPYRRDDVNTIIVPYPWFDNEPKGVNQDKLFFNSWLTIPKSNTCI